MLTRLLLIALLAALCLFSKPRSVIHVVVDQDLNLRVTIPDIRKQDLSDILAVILAKGDENARQQFESLFPAAKSVTITLSSLGDPK
jgi:hypothetical protein